MGGRSLRVLLPRRVRARVRDAEELRMGSPQYGQLVLDGEPLSGRGELPSLVGRWRKARRAGACRLA